MTGVDERAFVAAMYDGPGWKQKVREMSDAQVFAIYSKEMEKQQSRGDKPKAVHRDETTTQDDIPF